MKEKIIKGFKGIFNLYFSIILITSTILITEYIVAGALLGSWEANWMIGVIYVFIALVLTIIGCVFSYYFGLTFNVIINKLIKIEKQDNEEKNVQQIMIVGLIVSIILFILPKEFLDLSIVLSYIMYPVNCFDALLYLIIGAIITIVGKKVVLNKYS